MQLDIFNPVKRYEKKPYPSLTIHEKINFKANLCGFSSLVYTCFNLVNDVTPIRIKYDRLTTKYFWHHKVNAGSEQRIKNYRKTKKTLTIWHD